MVDNLKAPLMCRLIRRYETAVVVVLAVSLNERQWLPVGNQCPCNVKEGRCHRWIGGEVPSFGIKGWVDNIASGHNGLRSAGSKACRQSPGYRDAETG